MRTKLALFLTLLTTPAFAWSHGLPSFSSTSLPAGTYFVAQSGDDNNTGTSSAHPWRTIAKVQAQTFAAGSIISFKGGDSFIGGLVINSSLSPSGNITINSYGTGLASIFSDNETSCINSGGVSNVTINGIDCEGPGNNNGGFAGGVDGIQFNSSGNGTTTSGITIQNSVVNGYGASGISFINLSGAAFTSGWSNVSITGNTVHDSTGGQAPAQFPSASNNVSCIEVSQGGSNTNVTINNNTVFNCIGNAATTLSVTGFGIFVNGASTYSISNNIVHNVGLQNVACGGPVAIISAKSSSGTVQFNEVYNTSGGVGTTGCNGDAYDLDLAVSTTTVQYNYAHGILTSLATGMLLFNDGTSVNNIVRFNIFETPTISFQTQQATGNQIYNNTFFVAGSGSPGCWTSVNPIIANINFSNNICYTTTSNAFNFERLDGTTYAGQHSIGNDWYAPSASSVHWQNLGGNNNTSLAAFQTDCGSNCTPAGITTNPNLTAAGSGQTCNGYNPPCPAAYSLTAASPAGKGNGQNLNSVFSINPGTQDFYGNAITNTTLPIGAAANK